MEKETKPKKNDRLAKDVKPPVIVAARCSFPRRATKSLSVKSITEKAPFETKIGIAIRSNSWTPPGPFRKLNIHGTQKSQRMFIHK